MNTQTINKLNIIKLLFYKQKALIMLHHINIATSE